MARVDDTASLAAAEADVSRDAARRLDVVFRSGAGFFSILVLLIAWEAFARSGNPNNAAIPTWPAYRLADRATMVFDVQSRVANDFRGDERILLAGLKSN